MENFETYRLDQTGQQTQAILDQVSTNTADIAQLRALYEALTQSEPVIIQPSDTWPVADPEENVIYRVIDRVNTPPQSYSDYMWNGTAMVLMATYNNSIDNEPTPGSNNLVKSGGVAASIVFDISAYHATGSTLATYADLAAALGTDGANVPASVRKGGMSVKFVQSSDNKYVQYRLMADTFNTTVTQWQGVDDEPTAGSENLVKSGGIFKQDKTFYSNNISDYNIVANYIRNIYVIPTSDSKYDYLKNLASPLVINYVGVKSNAVSGTPDAAFGIQLYTDDNNFCSYSVLEVPDLTKNGVVELTLINQGVGNLNTDIRVFVEFTASPDFVTPVANWTHGNVFVNTFERTQISLLKEILINASNIENISVVHEAKNELFKFLKNTDVDYRAIKNIVKNWHNLFDANNVVENVYAYNGGYVNAQGFCASKFPVPLKAGATYKSNDATGMHVDILNGENLSFITHISSEDSPAGWNIVVEGSYKSFTVPAELTNVCALFSFSINDAPYIIVNEGNKVGDKRGGVSLIEDESFVIVDKNGNGDYLSLTEACNKEPTGTIIIVNPGVYDNEVMVGGKTKTFYIIGIDRDKCVIKNNLRTYANAPIHIASGLLRNLTIVQEGTQLQEGEHGGYAVHVDFEPMYNSTLRIENCYIKSNLQNAGCAIGIGLWGGGSLTIKDCRIEGANGGLLCHDSANLPYIGEQHLNIDNCTIIGHNSNSYAISIIGESQKYNFDFSTTQFYIEFLRTRTVGSIWFENDPGGEAPISVDDYMGVKNLRLSEVSWGNSNDDLNYE